ncbi:MAG: hypothetical protein KGJ80_10915 [Chloroflexota bacterium]|nr:hypothetical protein [Chloroflexota bacterium]
MTKSGCAFRGMSQAHDPATILGPATLQVLGGKFTDGDTVVVDLDAARGKIVFYKEEKRAKKKAA